MMPFWMGDDTRASECFGEALETVVGLAMRP